MACVCRKSDLFCCYSATTKAYLVNCGLDVAGVSSGHGLQSNRVLAADLHWANLQL